MQLRRYEAPTIQEAFKRIKAELGDQAVIFSTKTVNKGKDKATSNGCWIEVTAAVDRNANCQLQIVPNNSSISQAARFGMAEDSSFDPLKSHPSEMGVPEGVYRDSSYMTYLRNLIWAGFSHETAWYMIGEAHAEQAHQNNINS
jgi:flagellar biosynthesis GTPase FlhF